MKRKRMVVAALAGLALVLAACNGNDAVTPPPVNDETPPPPDADVAVSLIEWDVVAEPGAASAGSVTFAVSNDGTMPHELVVIRSDIAEDQLPQEGGAADEDAEGVEPMGETDEFPANQSRTLTLDLEAGSYVLICNIAGHYQLGMHTSFTVT